ncbi:MAG: hypothetical protein ACJAYU_000918 [Bradymonadia bacterium]|jgi:hypothetical protein
MNTSPQNRIARPLFTLASTACLVLVALTPAFVGCGGEDGAAVTDNAASLLPVANTSLAVGETARVALSVDNPDGLTLSYAFEGPELPGLDLAATIGGTATGGEFVFTPLASHVGAHDFQFTISSSAGDSSQSARITVEPGASSAPIFLSPGAGGTFDLTRSPCVSFDIEVRDDDSGDVLIEATTSLPSGADLSQTAEKSASFEWCPSPDQVDASRRWEIGFSADDGDHAATEHLFVVILRVETREDCPGTAPSVTIESPGKGDTITSTTGYELLVNVSDDRGVRDAPIVYWTTDESTDEEEYDLTVFEQRPCDAAAGGRWSCTIPPFDLADGEERLVFTVVSATDNDDDSGTSCDHTTESDLTRFFAAQGDDVVAVPLCGVCTSSAQCETGVCASTPTGGRCTSTCDTGCGDGECGQLVTADGLAIEACGPVDAVCGESGGDCLDDEFEENDSPAEATDVATGDYAGQICADDLDFFQISVEAGTEILALLDGFQHVDGDLDLFLLAGDEAIIAVSESSANEEFVSWCATETDTVTLAVLGYSGAENPYNLSVLVEDAACCVDDVFEPDDSLDDPRIIEAGDAIEGSICPDDDDYLAFEVTDDALVTFLLVFDSLSTDLDIELYDEDGLVVAFSETAGDEEIEVLIDTPGIYTIRVFGFLGDAGDYLGELTIEGL